MVCGVKPERPVMFDTRRPAGVGERVGLSPLVARVLAPNAGAMTFSGTVTYLVGHRQLAIIDPGPDDPAHVDALLRAVGNARVSHILVTHTHLDHTGAVAALVSATGAKVIGCAPHAGFNQPVLGGWHPPDSHIDHLYRPDEIMADGGRLETAEWSFEAVSTPGHTRNHMCFALAQEQALFSGDHVMGWATTTVSPPEGDMAAYRASLAGLLQRPERLYYPAHGHPVSEPVAYVEALLAHRQQRQEQVEECAMHQATIEGIVDTLYPSLEPLLRRAAMVTVLAHLLNVPQDDHEVHARAVQLIRDWVESV
jgi:glyoxylase-like metal-dependent hydrolase (beta-lactamase superfamily II)